jgi:plasmid stabilization system protein ParE
LLVLIREAALEEIAAASAWHGRQRPGLGAEFVAQVETSIEILSEHPEAFPTIGSDVRRALVRRFPFVLYYRVLDLETLEVLAVLHQRRETTRVATADA